MGARSRTETELLPLGKGYRRPRHFLQTWADRAGDERGPGFSMAASLRRAAPLLPAGYLSRVLGNGPDCLISGCSIAENPRSLAQFLSSHGVDHPTIQAIDLIDVSKIWKPKDSVRYHVADASDLCCLFADESFNLIVQDHLLNCASISDYSKILGEMARILRPDGLILLNYTDSRRIAQQHLGTTAFTNSAHACRNSNFSGRRASGISTKYKLVRADNGYIVVTEPWGNPESFISFSDFELRLIQASLVIKARLCVDIIDPNGVPCHRNYCLLTRR